MNNKIYNEDLKKVWRPNWLSRINELTSLELQKRSWLDNDAPSPHWSFVEFMCSYFDDLGVENAYKDPLVRGLLSKQEFDIIKEWHDVLDKYNSPNDDDYNVANILSDPKWLEILELGIVAKNNLAKVLSESERQFLTEEIDHRKYG